MELGHTARDVITGFQGVVIGTCQYLTGCNQALLQPGVGPPPTEINVTKRPDSEWFDVQRLVAVEGVAPISLNNGTTPGCDREAPKR